MSEGEKRPSAADRKRAFILLAGAVLLFSAAFLVSRLADLGAVAGEPFGAGDWRRAELELDIQVVPGGGGAPRRLGRDLVVAPGDRLRFTYPKTRYLYLWVVRVAPGGVLEPLLPPPSRLATGAGPDGRYGRSTANNGETIPETVIIPDDPGPFVLMALFTPIPRRLDELEAAAAAVGRDEPERVAREMYLPSQRFVHRLEIRRPEPAAAPEPAPEGAPEER